MTSRVPSLCQACARFTGGVCTAYPDGIPAGIIFFGEPHMVPRPGDHGKQFVQGDSEEQLQAFNDWQATFG
jgi:hypothetical protein